MGRVGGGWKMGGDMGLEVGDKRVIVSDKGGRRVYFEEVFGGEEG